MKYFENPLIFDEVKAYKKWCQFYGAKFWATLYTLFSCTPLRYVKNVARKTGMLSKPERETYMPMSLDIVHNQRFIVFMSFLFLFLAGLCGGRTRSVRYDHFWTVGWTSSVQFWTIMVHRLVKSSSKKVPNSICVTDNSMFDVDT